METKPGPTNGAFVVFRRMQTATATGPCNVLIYCNTALVTGCDGAVFIAS